MRNPLRLLVCLAALGISASPAPVAAGTLTSATWVSEAFGLWPGASFSVPVTATGGSSGSAVSVSLTLPPFAGGSFGVGGPINTYQQLTLSGVQAITATPGMANVVGSIQGHVTFKNASHTMGSMLDPMTTLARLPLSIGQNGSATTTWVILGSYHYFTVDFYAWTPGTRTFTGLTSMGLALPNEVVMGSFDLTAMGGGSVLLVAPTRISVDGFPAQQRSLAVTRLKLNFVPEPGALLLLGAAALALLRQRRG